MLQRYGFVSLGLYAAAEVFFLRAIASARLWFASIGCFFFFRVFHAVGLCLTQHQAKRRNSATCPLFRREQNRQKTRLPRFASAIRSRDDSCWF